NGDGEREDSQAKVKVHALSLQQSTCRRRALNKPRKGHKSKGRAPAMCQRAPLSIRARSARNSGFDQMRLNVPRLTNRPSPFLPTYFPFSTTTSPRDSTCVAAPTTSRPSNGE